MLQLSPFHSQTTICDRVFLQVLTASGALPAIHACLNFTQPLHMPGRSHASGVDYDPLGSRYGQKHVDDYSELEAEAEYRHTGTRMAGAVLR